MSAAQSELLVAPLLSSDNSEESSILTMDPLGSSTCRSLPMLSAASLEENATTSSSSSSSMQNDKAQQKTSIRSDTDKEEQSTSSTAASMTLNSSTLDEMDEIEEPNSEKSPSHVEPPLAIGSFELIQLRAAVHYGESLSFCAKFITLLQNIRSRKALCRCTC